MSNDAAKLMAYDAAKKSVGAAFLLWFFLGGIGAHRFYAGKTATGVAFLVMHLLGWLTLGIGLGFVLFSIIGIWWLVDAFLVSGMIRQANLALASKIQVSLP